MNLWLSTISCWWFYMRSCKWSFIACKPKRCPFSFGGKNPNPKRVLLTLEVDNERTSIWDEGDKLTRVGLSGLARGRQWVVFQVVINVPRVRMKVLEIHRRWDGFPTAKVFKQHTVLQCDIGIIGVNGIQDAFIANLALGSETNEAADERIRRVGPLPPPHVVGIENLESPITLLLLLLSPLPSFLSLCFPLSSRSPPPPASSSSFAQQQNKLAHSTMPLLVHALTTNCSAYGRARDTHI